MSAFVIDTNVLIVANFNASHASPGCALSCIDILKEIRENHTVVVDSVQGNSRILDEYQRHNSHRGQPGVGDAFFKWLWDNQIVTAHCERVRITPLPDDPDSYEEFPPDPGLQGFDRADRKFVAVALASESDPVVLNAVDSDWLEFRERLEGHGVSIRFLCPDSISRR